MFTSFQEMQGPLFHFEFPNENGEVQPICFYHPFEVIQAKTIEEVIPCLEKVQHAVRLGYYVAGYLTYESAPAFDSAYAVPHNQAEISGTEEPCLYFAVFDSPRELPNIQEASYAVTDWEPQVNKDTYRKNFLQVLHHIEAGKTNQVNYTIRLGANFVGDDFTYFKQLTSSQLANYSCYIKTDQQRILSASPELFFHIQDGVITTRPMAGTAKRGKTKAEDEAAYSWLQHSDKNKLENKLTVDVLRQDVMKISKEGTVQATSLFDIEAYPTVYQMTSTVKGEIREGITIVDIFRALFPCGSITGDPKSKTMEIIAEVESSPRGVYCGAIGFITPKGDMTFNVPIRTVVMNETTGKAQYGVGGGITINSEVGKEYEEIQTKAAVLEQSKQDFQLLESLLLENGSYFLLGNHVARLLQSATFFSFPVDQHELEGKLLHFAEMNNAETMKVRVLVSQHGDIHIEGERIFPKQTLQKVALATKPIQKANIFLQHKTTNRELYEGIAREHLHEFDVLLWNEDGELTEFTMGNVVLELAGKLYTPPLTSGLLPGTYRKHLLDTGKISERILTLHDLRTCTKLWFINSVRKWIEVEL